MSDTLTFPRVTRSFTTSSLAPVEKRVPKTEEPSVVGGPRDGTEGSKPGDKTEE